MDSRHALCHHCGPRQAVASCRLCGAHLCAACSIDGVCPTCFRAHHAHRLRLVPRRAIRRIAVLLLVLLPALLTQVYYSGWVHSPISRTESMLQNLATILQEYVMNMGDCPETLEAFYTRGYLRERRTVDAWGRPIDFQCRGREAAVIYRLRSAGQDGALGTEDDIIVE